MVGLVKCKADQQLLAKSYSVGEGENREIKTGRKGIGGDVFPEEGNMA